MKPRMNLNYFVGRMLAWPLAGLLRSPWFPLLRTFHGRRDWLYDICRYANTREFRVLFDVGANVGQTAGAMRRYFPRAEIHAFEPIDETHRMLSRNARRWPNVRPHRLAMGRASETREVVLQNDSLFNSLRLSAPLDAGAERRLERIEVSTVDEFCERHGIDTVDVLKIDAQGYDLEVLLGAGRMLSAKRVAFVFVEVGFQPNDIINSPFAPLNEHLTARGFRLSGFYEQWGCIGDPSLAFCNALYFHPDALLHRFPGTRV
jgi:FkbM family methyltransferase